MAPPTPPPTPPPPPPPTRGAALVVEVSLAAPVWQPFTYGVPPELAPLIHPLTRLLVPLRGRPSLAFALGEPRPAGGEDEGLKDVADVLDEAAGPQMLPPGLLRFFERAAAHYQTPLGQALAWSLPAGFNRPRPPAASPRRGGSVETILHFRPGRDEDLPRAGSQARALLARVEKAGSLPLGEAKAVWPRAGQLAHRLEAAGWLRLTHQPAARDLLGRPLVPEPPPEQLSPDQEAALAELLPAVAAQAFRPFLLNGVTGSGKTEVFLAACRAALGAGRDALLLTPEIGLTLRLAGLLESRFGGGQVAVLHSGLSPAERRGEWARVAAGQARVVVGARSAVFAPLARPGVIVVDEEQDEAYKQEDRWRYHARDLALLRGQEQGCPVILGTATPAVTTWERARRGEIGLLSLPRRVGGAKLPRLEVVDLKGAGPLRAGFLSPRLHQALGQTVAAGRQAILFLNRRGFAPALLCTGCGKTVGCPSCSVSLTLHRAAGRLVCHVCGHTRPVPPACPGCGGAAEGLKPLGVGTEQVAAALAEAEPTWRVGQLDRDTAHSPAALKAFLSRVARQELDVVVGTQMITKGHHFPLISLVGVLLADQALAQPDFRAAERAYTVLTQAAGRAGRAGGEGLVIVQTYDPHHPAVQAAVRQAPEEFYARELAERRALGYPPFGRLIGLRLDAAREDAARDAARHLGACLQQARAAAAPAARVLGPAPAPLARAAGRWRFLLLIKAPDAPTAGRLLRLGLHRAGRLPQGVSLAVDVDPVSLG
ncbi:MAG: primosomal protein N' [Deltaproteobacteria bacterium]|nr:primosomal protein N' [Deltaproteobacteria bacterium]